jgi:hypothetical protein
MCNEMCNESDWPVTIHSMTRGPPTTPGPAFVVGLNKFEYGDTHANAES